MHPETCQPSKMELYKKKVNIWKPLTIFTKSSILDAWQGSGFTSDKYLLRHFIRYLLLQRCQNNFRQAPEFFLTYCVEYEQVICLLAFEWWFRKSIVFSISVQCRIKVTTYLAKRLINVSTNCLNLIAQLLRDLKDKIISVSERIFYYTLAASSLVWTFSILRW